MIMEAIKRCMIGIAFGGIITFIALTVLKFSGMDATVSEIWLNMLSSFIIGIYFGLSSFVFHGNDWSILKQTIIHLIMSIVVYLIIALYVGWVPLSVTAILWCSLLFIIIYAVFWTGYYLSFKKMEESMNGNLEKKN